MTGAGAMAWKELREIFMAEGRPAVQMAVAGVMDLVFGIGMPIFIANLFLDGLGLWGTVGVLCAGVAGVGAFMGIFGPMPTIADAFAGERERHTLETLLASPLPDGSILWGKMLAQYTVVGAHVALVSVTAGITSAILLGLPGLLVLPAGLLLGGAGAAVTSSFIVGLGILLSLRAPTVKKAQERISYVMMPIFLLPAFGPALVGGGVTIGPVAAIAISVAAPAILLVGAVTFNIMVFARFRRDRLIGLA
ncbi:MAG: type transport system permease protein [Thermoplasmata archaeon]|jgi:ABC-2 type transport system permease protein|nr:type transport system permease protein [Thermoplasmata archaeon]MEA3167036.1 type transport system permease protein [Thermoplasmata archaeon]